jgi:hypothetical protein
VGVELCISVFQSVYKKNPIPMFCFNQKSVGFFGLNTIFISGEEMGGDGNSPSHMGIRGSPTPLLLKE